VKSNAVKSSNKRKRASAGVAASSVAQVLEEAGSLDEDEEVNEGVPRSEDGTPLFGEAEGCVDALGAVGLKQDRDYVALKLVQWKRVIVCSNIVLEA
ncbi:hypothetical protein NL676_002094, partial [Syzygium grande]